jgi:hypothetical protein
MMMVRGAQATFEPAEGRIFQGKELIGRNVPDCVLIHIPKGMAVSFDPFNNARGQQVLCCGAIKDPICFVGEIGETSAFTHVETYGGLFDVDVKIVFSH